MAEKLSYQITCQHFTELRLFEFLLANCTGQEGKGITETPKWSFGFFNSTICHLFSINKIISIVWVQNPVSDNFTYLDFFMSLQKFD